MANKIAPNVVVGHSFISTKRTELTLEEIYQYCEIADKLLEPKYFVNSYKTCIDYFSKNYSYLFTQEGDTLKVNCDIRLLIRYFRLGLPKDLVKILDEAGEKFNSMKNDKKQNLNVMAIPYNKPYIIRKDRIEEFMNQKPNETFREENKDLIEKFKIRIRKK